jgi:tight adherence protein B
MELTVPVAALLGAGTALGLLLILLGLAGRVGEPAELDEEFGASSWWARRIAARGLVDRRRVAWCLAVGVLVGIVTRWPVAAILAPAAAWVLPQLLRPDRGHGRRVDRMEAIATWTESMRDNLSGAAGLEQAIATSAIEPPQPIREEVTRLSTRLRRSWRLSDALAAYADETADPTNDLVVAGLAMAARGSAGDLGESLGEVADSARAKVASRQRIAASRRRNHTSARVIVGTTLGVAVVMALLNRAYLRPFDSAAGQLALLAAGCCFALAFAGVARLMRDRDPSRILAGGAATAESETPAVPR